LDETVDFFKAQKQTPSVSGEFATRLRLAMIIAKCSSISVYLLLGTLTKLIGEADEMDLPL